MTTTNNKDELDEVLREVTGEFAAQYRLRNEAKEPYSIELAERAAEDALLKAKAWILTHFRSVEQIEAAIGEDERCWTDHFGVGHNVPTDGMDFRNGLRHKIRQALKLEEK